MSELLKAMEQNQQKMEGPKYLEVTKPSNPKDSVEKETRYIDSLDLAYAAGLIDGEGCIGIYHNSHNGNYQLRITVEMVEREGLDHLDSLINGSWYFKEKKSPRRDCYVWMLFNSNAEEFLRWIKPYIRVKTQQIDVALSCNWSGFKGGQPLNDQQEKRKDAHLKMKELNKRGRD